MSLSPKHLEDLRASGLSDETIAAAGLYTEADADRVRELLGGYLSIKVARGMGPCLAFPYLTHRGEAACYPLGRGGWRPFVRLKPDTPRPDKRAKEGAKTSKYESPLGSSGFAYFPPGTRSHAVLCGRHDRPILLTEGEKKALCADQHGFHCIGLIGVYGWQQKREKGEDGKGTGPREWIPDLTGDNVSWQDRHVVIVFDSDAVENQNVLWAEWHLAERLAHSGAKVQVARLPKEPDGKKNGLDDFIVRHGADAFRAVIEAATPPVKPVGVGPGGSPKSNDNPNDPHLLAEKFLDFISPGDAPSYRLRSWRDDFWLYNRGAYTLCPPGDLQAKLADWTRKEFVRQNIAAVAAWREGKGENMKDEKPPTTFPVTTSLLRNVTQALRGMCLLPAWIDSPAWIDGHEGADPAGIMAMRNGLLDLEAVAAGKPDHLLPPDRRFFTTAAVPFAYDPAAPQPVEWLKFLRTIWPDDPESIAKLQEWFGYTLTADTRQQKVLLFLGPKRSGKGTIARVWGELVGPNNVVGPTLGSLATNFGLWPLIGKTLAIVSDARLGGRTDTAVITERLLAISGEDALTIDRKHQTMLTAKLPTRFVILSNEMLRLGDSSGALVGRLIMLRATRSFYGKEDHGLFDRLRAELPGILLWAIEGWRHLRGRGRFEQPRSGADLVKAMEDLSSPVLAFVRDRCRIDPAAQVEVEDLYATWKALCDSHGRRESGTAETFGRDIRAAVASVTRSRIRSPEGRVYVYKGIRIKTLSDEIEDDEPDDLFSVPSASLARPQQEDAANPMEHGPSPVSLANADILHMRAKSDGEADQDMRPMVGRCDHQGHPDHPRCRCGQPAMSRTCGVCRFCYEAEEQSP